MNSRRITLIVAVVLAIGTGVLTLHYLTGVNKTAQAQVVEMRPLIIANVEIPARSKIRPQMLTKIMKPAAEIEPGAIVDAKQAEGDVTLVTIPQGAPLTQGKIGVPASVGVTGRLKNGQRAVSIPVDNVKSVSGLIEPGDRVDVVASVGASGGTRAPHAATIIRDATVLAVNAVIEPNTDASPPPGGAAPTSGPTSVTLAVTAAQADLLTVADLNATLRLALRPPDEPLRSLASETLDLQQAAPPAAAAPAAPAQPAAPVTSPLPKPTVPGVTIIDGDKVVAGAPQ